MGIHIVQFLGRMKQQLLLLGLLAAQALCVKYSLDIVTGSRKCDGTDGSFEATVIGSKGRVNLGELDNPNHNDFEVGAIDNFQVDSKTDVYNTDGTYLSSDTSEGKAVMKFCKQGDATYKFEITTANEKWADTDNIHARLTVSSKGNKGNTTTGILDNQGVDDFVMGATDTFTLYDLKNVGKAGCIVLTAEQDDAWLFDTIKVTRGGMTRVFKNEDKVWLSSDTSEGSNELEICN